MLELNQIGDQEHKKPAISPKRVIQDGLIGSRQTVDRHNTIIAKCMSMFPVSSSA